MTTFVLMASGPSMCKDDADLVRDWRDGETKKALAINNTYMLAPWADYIYACDRRWWDQYYDGVKKTCTGELWCHDKKPTSQYGINRIDNGQFRNAGNSGVYAANLSITMLGAKKLILLGYDMQNTNGLSHWHGDHPPNWPAPTNFGAWCGWMKRLAMAFPNIEIVNASRETALELFPRVDLRLALCE